MKPDHAPPGKKRSEYPTRLSMTFAILALASCLGLDFLAAKRGEPAYIFGFLRPKEPARQAPVSLVDTVLGALDQAGLKGEEILRGRDETGAAFITVNLSRERYDGIEPQVQANLKRAGLRITVEKKDEGKTTCCRWLITRGKDERLSIAFALPNPTAEETARALPPPPKHPSPGDTAAIIIDDMGNSLDVLSEILDLNMPLTISILPFSPYAAETARIAHEHGLEVMVHLPGESLNNTEDYGAGDWMIRAEMSEDEIKALVKRSLDAVPYASGANNHMGSKITQLESVMRPLLEAIRERNLFFVDSRTTSRSIAYDLALEMGLPTASRHVFLDSTVGVEFSKQKITDLLRMSRETGGALAIAHPFPETIRALKEGRRLFEEFRVRPVFASQLVSAVLPGSHNRPE